MKSLSILLFLLLTAANCFAQSEVRQDSLSNKIFENVKMYDDFMIDMDLMMIKPVELQKTNLQKIEMTKDYSALFSLSPDVVYSQGSTRFSSPSFGFLGNSGPGTLHNMQMGSFRLKNGWQLNTYGDYNSKGYRVANPSALPWERSNFRGAFELKSSNGNFGVRVEVQQGRTSPF